MQVLEGTSPLKMEKKEENNGGNSGHYVVASRPPDGDRLQRHCCIERKAKSC